MAAEERGAGSEITEYSVRRAADVLADDRLRAALERDDARVFVVGGRDAGVLRTAEAVMTLLPEVVAGQQAALSRARIEELIRLLTPDRPANAIEARIAGDNAALRQRFLQEVPCLSSRQVHELAGSRGRNTSQTASTWKRKGRIFSVPYGGRDHYPAFQFADGRPHPVVAEVLQRLPEPMTPWQTAFWFVTGNGWLRGRAPKDMLNDRDAVLKAAAMANHDVVG